ncbi:MAG: helix-hairpin-helix domain-containing protein, partial [Pseudomonadota bacterium]|nr:helix-hairpin-helix domain-containing protein [Pseudomonadota bacterium]
MMAFVQANWPGCVVVLLIALALAWWLWSTNQRNRGGDRRERYRAPDALDEGAAPAARNQAFIDAPSAAAAVTAPLAATGPDILGGIGEIAAWGAAREVGNVEPVATAEPIPIELPTLPPSSASGANDDLTRIKGVGPKLSTRLAELGVTSFAQIAAWSDADLAAIDGRLGAFAGRP